MSVLPCLSSACRERECETEDGLRAEQWGRTIVALLRLDEDRSRDSPLRVAVSIPKKKKKNQRNTLFWLLC